MGLTPDQFWDLTWHEFHLKHAAFMRAEDRQRALVFELAAMIGLGDEKVLHARNRSVGALRRYPIKPWVLKT